MTIPSHDEGGVLLSAVSVGIHGTTSKPALPTASEVGGHTTPDWELNSNLGLLYGNR
jgi:hypothetical protein